eukprot:TRINITY_DN8284_c0_g1_i3.p1 TRINITY_DN8284_c0_g1~~TRINITY_DN8284_c0_g1_i3.p1  ORF type:complete len:159 (+),score=22.33 TRINITY_DN8284_c0_g1_i3:28-504(+)
MISGSLRQARRLSCSRIVRCRARDPLRLPAHRRRAVDVVKSHLMVPAPKYQVMEMEPDERIDWKEVTNHDEGMTAMEMVHTATSYPPDVLMPLFRNKSIILQSRHVLRLREEHIKWSCSDDNDTNGSKADREKDSPHQCRRWETGSSRRVIHPQGYVF